MAVPTQLSIADFEEDTWFPNGIPETQDPVQIPVDAPQTLQIPVAVPQTLQMLPEIPVRELQRQSSPVLIERMMTNPNSVNVNDTPSRDIYDAIMAIIRMLPGNEIPCRQACLAGVCGGRCFPLLVHGNSHVSIFRQRHPNLFDSRRRYYLTTQKQKQRQTKYPEQCRRIFEVYFEAYMKNADVATRHISAQATAIEMAKSIKAFNYRRNEINLCLHDKLNELCRRNGVPPCN